MGPYNRDEPLSRQAYVRPALLWLLAPYLWLFIALRLPPDVFPGQSVLSFIIVWVPFLLAFFVFVTLSMRRLLAMAAPPALAWLSILPGAALPLYIVLAVAPNAQRAQAQPR